LLNVVLVYTLVIAFMMVSTIPTFSGKLLGERISREYVMPTFMLAVGFVALLVTYPFGTLTGASLAYLASIPVSWYRFGQMEARPQEDMPDKPDASPSDDAANDDGRIVAIRSGDQPH
jgi:CDP-diacylglycerol--serine O-phosphatidyltransferase